MSRSPRWDAIVVGAGPSGAMTAYFLARAGAKVALVDRAKFPREKPCGGGLAAKTVDMIPFDLSPAVETRLCGMSLSWKHRGRSTRRWPQTLVYGVRRLQFDDFLVGKAVDAGVALFDGTPVRGVDVARGGDVHLRGSRIDLSAPIVVGADGANTVVGRHINPPAAFQYNIGLYCEMPREWLVEDRVADDVMRIDTGSLPTGYAWIFPKRETINVGVGGPQTFARRYPQAFASFLSAEGILRTRSAEEVPFAGHRVPCPTAATRFRDGRILLVGDAAGLTDPSTGDGLHNGVESARIAADVVVEALGGQLTRLAQYEKRIGDEIVSELDEARAILALLNLSPAAFYKLFRYSDSKWAEICAAIIGKATYRQLREPCRALWTVVDPLLIALDDARMRQTPPKDGPPSLWRRATAGLARLRSNATRGRSATAVRAREEQVPSS